MKEYKNLNDYEIMYMISENDEDATNLLFTKYKPIIGKLAKEYYKQAKNCGLELEDFVQEGYYALYCAIKKYTEVRNSLFYTYAIICIRSKLRNLLITNTRNKDIPLNNSVSLFSEVDEHSLIDVISDKNALIPDVEIEEIELQDRIKDMLYNMSFEDSIVCELKLNGFTTKDIAKLLDKKFASIYRATSQLRKNLLIIIEKNNI